MGVGVCSGATPVFQPQKFNVSTLGRFDIDEDHRSQMCDTWSSERVLERNEVIFYKMNSQDRLKQCDRRKCVPKHKVRKQFSETWSSRRVERNEVIFYKTNSQDKLKLKCDRRRYVPKHKMRNPSRKSSIKGPTFGRRFQGLASKPGKSVSSYNYEIFDEIWIATQEAQRKVRGNSGTISSKSNRSFNNKLGNGESTDGSFKTFGRPDFNTEQSKRSQGKSSFSSSVTAIERESSFQKKMDNRLLSLMFYESDSSDSFAHSCV